MVWFKRDLHLHLHLHDRAPLVVAQANTHALGLFVIEPEWLQSPECDASHVDSALACLTELRAALAQRGMPLLLRVGSRVQALAQLQFE